MSRETSTDQNPMGALEHFQSRYMEDVSVQRWFGIRESLSGIFERAAGLHSIRLLHSASAISQSRVLVIGGLDAEQVLDGGEIYNPALDNWSVTEPLALPRYSHTATVLADEERVVVMGGRSPSGDALDSVEIYEVGLGRWRAGKPMFMPRVEHTATLLQSGHILVVGGRYFKEGAATVLGDVELYDPVGDQWQPVASLAHKRFGHTATLLSDGKVVIVGGTSSNAVVRETEVLDPATGEWGPGAALPDARANHTATRLADDCVLIAGGGVPLESIRFKRTYIYRAEVDKWEEGAWLPVPVSGATAVQLPSGNVMLVGGVAEQDSPRIAQIFNPLTKNWSSTYPHEMNYPLLFHTATVLAVGEVLIVAGTDPRLPHVNPIDWVCRYKP